MSAALDVAAWRPDPLTAAQHHVAVARAALRAALTEIESAPPAAWVGDAAEAAAQRHRALADQVRAFADTATQQEHALASAAQRLAALKAFAVPTGAPELDSARSAHALCVAHEIDADLTAALHRLASDVAVRADSAQATSVEALPVASISGKADPRQPAALVLPTPATWAIDRDNRLRLERAEQDLVAEVAALQRGPRTWRDLLEGAAGTATIGTFGGGSARLAYEQALAKLAAVRATRQVLDQRDGQTRQLLVFDVSGRSARVAVAVGDVDRAQHVAVVVPGFTTTVGRDLVGSDRLAADLADEARRAAALVGDRREVAVVSWLGYDIPQTADTFRGAHSVVVRRSAEAGAEALDGFLRSLPPDRHLTLVGHSYGSTTAGIATARPDTPVDDLVVMGSPGLGVDRTAELGVPPSRVHVLEASDDPVADLAWFGPDPDSIPGVNRLSTGAARLPDETEGEAATGHSRYLAPGTTSQWNVAAVVVGAPVVAVGRPPVSW